MTTQNLNNSDDKDDNKDPVLESLMNQIKSNYIENVEIEDLIEYEKNKTETKSSLTYKKLLKIFKNTE